MATRRRFLQTSIGGALSLRSYGYSALPSMSFGNERLDQTYSAALQTLRSNIQRLTSFSRDVLLEGAEYPGIWLECGPLEGLAYEPFSPDVAKNNHQIFFALQREDGYLPCSVKRGTVGAAQIQMVVPIAATAWDLYCRNRDAAFLEMSYRACSRWDDWLVRYRNTRGTGLCEAFCTYDTGHDNSPRFAGMPNRCAENDARLCPKVRGLPYLAPDLSASVYGGRIALAAMAREMGRSEEEARWLEQAEQIRRAILLHLYDPEDGAFYDRDADSRFVRIRGDVITRVVGEHVPDQKIFEYVYRAQLHEPRAFWTRYPFPSVAMDDPAFVRPIPRNSWGGASQALTALRAPRWMEHYGKYADLSLLMARWVEAISRNGGFLQQLDPESGVFTPAGPGYSPAALVFLEFASRLYGVRRVDDGLEWNCRLPDRSTKATSRVSSRQGDAHLQTDANRSRLLVGNTCIAEVTGTTRLVTTAQGEPLRLVGSEAAEVKVVLRRSGRNTTYVVQENTIVQLNR